MRAPLAIGGDGVAAIGSLGLDKPVGAPRFALASIDTAGGDVIETYRRA